MPIHKYQRVTTPGPDGTTLYFRNTETNEATELAELNGWYYVYVPDHAVMPEQPQQIQWQEVVMTEGLRQAISMASRPVQLINNQVVEMIRDRYSIDDEIKLLRIAPSDETNRWNAYVEECRAWGRAKKAEIGL